MSRIGKNPIQIPDNVTVSIDNRVVKVVGPKGELTFEYRPEIKVSVKDNEIVCEVEIETKQTPAYWGMTRAIINNMVLGVVNGFEKKLELIGVGYRVKSAGSNAISLSVGYSHPVEFKAPEGVSIEVEGNKDIIIKGIDKQLVGLTAAQIKKIRTPEPYKGKGIRYAGEYVKIKPGKAGKTA